MFIRTQENYREVFKFIVGLPPHLRIFSSTLFNILAGTYLERESYPRPSRYPCLTGGFANDLRLSNSPIEHL